MFNSDRGSQPTSCTVHHICGYESWHLIIEVLLGRLPASIAHFRLSHWRAMESLVVSATRVFFMIKVCTNKCTLPDTIPSRYQFLMLQCQATRTMSFRIWIHLSTLRKTAAKSVITYSIINCKKSMDVDFVQRNMLVTHSQYFLLVLCVCISETCLFDDEIRLKSTEYSLMSGPPPDRAGSYLFL